MSEPLQSAEAWRSCQARCAFLWCWCLIFVSLHITTKRVGLDNLLLGLCGVDCLLLGAILRKLIDLASSLKGVPGRTTSLAGLHSGLSFLHPLRNSLVAVLSSRSDFWHLERDTLLHNARRHGINALLQAHVGWRLGRTTALKVQNLAQAACVCGILTTNLVTLGVVRALATVCWAACLRSVCNCTSQTDNTSAACWIWFLGHY